MIELEDEPGKEIERFDQNKTKNVILSIGIISFTVHCVDIITAIIGINPFPGYRFLPIQSEFLFFIGQEIIAVCSFIAVYMLSRNSPVILYDNGIVTSQNLYIRKLQKKSRDKNFISFQNVINIELEKINFPIINWAFTKLWGRSLILKQKNSDKKGNEDLVVTLDKHSQYEKVLETFKHFKTKGTEC
jgi:hypothetical protein